MTGYAITTGLFLAGSLASLYVGIREATRAGDWSDVRRAAVLIVSVLVVVFALTL